METTIETPLSGVEALESERTELKARLANFEEQLRQAEGAFNSTTRRVSEALASVDDLTPVGARRDNLSEIVKRTTDKIKANGDQLQTARAEVERAASLAELKELAEQAQEAAANFGAARERACAALEPALAEMRAASTNWDSARSWFLSKAEAHFSKSDPVPESAISVKSGMGHNADSKAFRANELVTELKEAGVALDNVITMLPGKNNYGVTFDIPKTPCPEGGFHWLTRFVTRCFQENK